MPYSSVIVNSNVQIIDSQQTNSTDLLHNLFNNFDK